MLARGESEVGKFTNDKNPVKARLAQAFVAVSQAWREQFKDFPEGSAPIAQPPVEQALYPIDIPTVSKEIYQEVKEAVEKTGYIFFAAIRSSSMEEQLAEDQTRAEPRIAYVNPSKTMRATVPPAMEVAINPTRVALKNSDHSTDEQLEMIHREEVRVKKKLPEHLRSYVSIRMVDPSTTSQIEDRYMDATGKLLYPDFFARTDVQTVPGGVAFVGRSVPAGQRDVGGWDRVHGRGDVRAVPVVVLPRVSAI